MKVIYETVEMLVRRAINKANEQDKRIARIDLTVAEANELADSLRPLMYISNPLEYVHYFPGDWGKVIGTYMGVRLQIEPKPSV